MAEYIDREAAIKAVRCSPDEAINDELEQIVREVPAAKVKPLRHGWWKTPAVGMYGCLCSVCKKQSDNCFDFCPTCGAKMDGEPS